MVTDVAIFYSSIISKYRKTLNCTIVWPTFYFKTIVRIFAAII